MAFKLKESNQPNTPLKKEQPNWLKKEITLFQKSTFTNKFKEVLYVELNLLVNAGIPLKNSLELIKDNIKKQNHKVIFEDIILEIINGSSFSDALKQSSKFSSYEYYSIQIGEESGTLSEVTKQLGDFYTQKNNQRKIIINALSYPIIILSTAFLVILFMLNFVVPMFQDIFKQQNVKLPGITQFIIDCSDFVKTYGILILLTAIGIIIAQPFLLKQENYKNNLDKFILKIPVLGTFIKMIHLAQFTQAIALLTAAKLPVVNSLDLVKNMINFSPLKNDINTCQKEIVKGLSFSESLKNTTMFDDKIIAMIHVAEETNQNEYIFKRLSKQYNLQIEQKSKALSSLLEPLVIAIIGVIVGIVVVAMYLPMFKLNSVF